MSSSTEILLARMMIDADYRRHLLAEPVSVVAALGPNQLEKEFLAALHPLLSGRARSIRTAAPALDVNYIVLEGLTRSGRARLGPSASGLGPALTIHTAALRTQLAAQQAVADIRQDWAVLTGWRPPRIVDPHHRDAPDPNEAQRRDALDALRSSAAPGDPVGDVLAARFGTDRIPGAGIFVGLRTTADGLGRAGRALDEVGSKAGGTLGNTLSLAGSSLQEASRLLGDFSMDVGSFNISGAARDVGEIIAASMNLVATLLNAAGTALGSDALIAAGDAISAAAGAVRDFANAVADFLADPLGSIAAALVTSELGGVAGELIGLQLEQLAGDLMGLAADLLTAELEGLLQDFTGLAVDVLLDDPGAGGGAPGGGEPGGGDQPGGGEPGGDEPGGGGEPGGDQPGGGGGGGGGGGDEEDAGDFGSGAAGGTHGGLPAGAHPGTALIPPQDSSLGRIGIALGGAIGGDPVGFTDGDGGGAPEPETPGPARPAGGFVRVRGRSLDQFVKRFNVDPSPEALRAQTLVALVARGTRI